MTAVDRRFELSPFQRDLVLSVCSAGTRILDSFRSKSRAELCPVHVRLAVPSGSEYALYLRLDRAPRGVEREARVLPILRRLGLPVPEVLAGPVRDPNATDIGAMAVYTELPGTNLLERVWSAPLGTQRTVNDALADQLLEGIDRIHSCSTIMAREDVSRLLPRDGLVRELRWALDETAASSPDDPWAGEPWLEPVVAVLQPLLEREERVTPPACFWNGDFNPANFLSDGTQLTGFVDFSWASWHDPHYGLARFTIYDWVLFDRPRLFRRYRERHDLSESGFSLRSAVHAVTTLLSKPHGSLTPAQHSSICAQLEHDMALVAG